MRRLRLVLLCALMVLGANAFVSVSASALHWHAVRCNDRAGRDGHSRTRNIDTLQCEGSLIAALHLYELENLLIKEKELYGISSKGGLQTISTTIGLVNVNILCSELSNEGTIEDPAGGGAGKATVTLLFAACKVDPSEDKCTVAGEMFTASSLVGVLEGTESSPVISFSPKVGTTLGELTLEKCVPETLNGKYKLTGSVLAQLNNNGSSKLTFKEETISSMLEMGGSKAGLEGEDVVTMTGGGAILAGV